MRTSTKNKDYAYDDIDNDYSNILFTNDFLESYDIAQIIHELESEDVAILLLKHLGYKPKEIMVIMDWNNMMSYYEVNGHLKRAFLSIKEKNKF